MRLDRFIANNLDLRRKQVQRWIRAGRVEVNHEYVRDPGFQLAQEHRVSLDGRIVDWRRPLYLMLHKPAGFICATADAHQPIILDLLPAELRNTKDLQIVGRLDADTTGLLLLTTDGQWNHRLTAPNRSHKTYRVTLAHEPTDTELDQLREGILLRNEAKMTLPCEIEKLTNLTYLMTLKEGRYHQVKRMFAAQGNKVLELHRTRVGAIVLPADLAPGEHRMLTTQEIAAP